MVDGNKGLGRGLDALLGGSRSGEATDPANGDLPLGAIVPNPHQPRREFSEDSLRDLADSIKAQGVLQPILVRPLGGGRYELVAGERRLRASKLAGRSNIPAVIREMSDQESLAIALIENLQREDLDPIEESLGYQRLMAEFGLSQEELSRQVGKSRSAVSNALRLLSLPATVQEEIGKGSLSAGHGRALLAVGEAAAPALAERIRKYNLSVRQAEAEAAHWKASGELPAEDDSYQRLAGAEKAGTRGRAAAKSVDPAIQGLQADLAASLGVKVRIAGDGDKGKLTLTYTSPDDLRRIVAALGAGE